MKRLFVDTAVSLVAVLLAGACGSALGAQGGEWPLEIESGGAKLVIYQPQPETLDDDKLTARAAVSVRQLGEAEPMFGAVWIDARISTDRDARLVTLLDVDVRDVKFPNATPEREAQVAKALETEIPKHQHTFSLDALLTTLDQADVHKASPDGIEVAPPKIVFATAPTVLVTIDGSPKMQSIDGSRVMRIVNTPFIILFVPATKTYHLRAGERWLRAADYTGPWQLDPAPPPEVVSVLAPAGYDKAVGARAANDAVDTKILVVTEPTELIVSDGEPNWTPIEGNDLLYLANSQNDVFMEVATQQYFVLLAGRWYRSTSLANGAWSYVPADKLPPAFAKIPSGSEPGSVRAFVAGTDEARDAVLDASIPQTSVVVRSQAQCSVTYDGEPKFKEIPGTKLTYAINTPDSVIAIDGVFYCCQQGVWFTAAAPLGPWTVCTSVPDEVHTIPPSCPVHPVSYVYVYDSTPDYVYVGYLPGYTGCYVYGPTVVYGTGWWYPGWYGSAYYPYPCTWGFAPHYNSWTCGWSLGLGYGWGVGAGWFSLSYGWGHPGWWGPAGFSCDHFDIHGQAVHFHAPPPVQHDVRAHAGAVVAQVGHDNIYRRPENVARNASPQHGGPAAARMSIASETPNNVFADRDGHVVRRTSSGWEEHAPGGWKPTDRVRRADTAAGTTGEGAPFSRQPPRDDARASATPRRESAAPIAPARPSPLDRERAITSPKPQADAPARELDLPITPPRSAAERPINPLPRRTVPPRARSQRDDFERMNRAREQGSSRASGFSQRSGQRAGTPARRGP